MYLIANTSGWNTRKAFDIFVLANQMYWSESTNYVEGASGTLKAANDMNYTRAEVSIAFDTVGAYTQGCLGGDPGSNPGPSASTGKKLSGSRGDWLYYEVNVPAATSNITASIIGGSGDADLYVREGSRPT